MVNIYFCGSIRGGRQLSFTYEKIIKILQVQGNVLTEHLGDDHEIETRDRVLSDTEIHDRDLRWVRESDLLIADVTIPSLGVGYEIGRAIEMGKPVMCLFNTSAQYTLSAMIAGCSDVKVHYYNEPESLNGILSEFIAAHAPGRTS